MHARLIKAFCLAHSNKHVSPFYRRAAFIAFNFLHTIVGCKSGHNFYIISKGRRRKIIATLFYHQPSSRRVCLFLIKQPAGSIRLLIYYAIVFSLPLAGCMGWARARARGGGIFKGLDCRLLSC